MHCLAWYGNQSFVLGWLIIQMTKLTIVHCDAPTMQQGSKDVLLRSYKCFPICSFFPLVMYQRFKDVLFKLIDLHKLGSTAMSWSIRFGALCHR